jgi:hypothetical protein
LFFLCSFFFGYAALSSVDLQVVLQAVDALVAANADNVLRAGYKKVLS